LRANGRAEASARLHIALPATQVIACARRLLLSGITL
jgi:hypothetical protein